jgi:hypothetical protein
MILVDLNTLIALIALALYLTIYGSAYVYE